MTKGVETGNVAAMKLPNVQVLPSRWAPTNATRLLALGALLLLGGCAGRPIYDEAALSRAKRIAIMPASDALGRDGGNAGPTQTGVLLGEIAQLQVFDVEGPGQMRKAFQQAGSMPGGMWSRELQARIADTLKIHLLAVGDVTDYRFWKKWKKADWVIGQTRYTETTWLVAVRLRLISPEDGRLVYCHQAEAESKEGYGPALLAANRAVLEPLRKFLEAQKK